jgi:hypothetical protein
MHEGEYRIRKFLPKFMGKKTINTSNVIYNPEDTTKKSEWICHMSERNKM